MFALLEITFQLVRSRRIDVGYSVQLFASRCRAMFINQPWHYPNEYLVRSIRFEYMYDVVGEDGDDDVAETELQGTQGPDNRCRWSSASRASLPTIAAKMIVSYFTRLILWIDKRILDL